jgi:hypothetical protein
MESVRLSRQNENAGGRVYTSNLVGRDFKAAVMNMQKDSMVDLSCLRKNW